jgi:hypothetical protein
MVERQSNAAWMVAEDASPPAPPVLARIDVDTRCGGQRPRLGLGHPHIDGNYRSTI